MLIPLVYSRRFVVICCLLYILCSCASSSSNNQPDWVSDPYSKYNRQAVVAAVGNGNTRQAAEKSAFGNLISFFGQSVQVDERVYTSYQEAVKNGINAGWTEKTSVNNEIITTAGIDTLIGAEIGEVWYDKKDTYYASAVMNKTKAIQIYTNLIDSNLIIINNLINIPANQKNSLEGFVRYKSAASIADVNQSYATILSVIGLGSFQTLKKGDEYRLEAQNISQLIPVGVRVRNDRVGRLQSAFSKVLTDTGFRTGGTNSRYIVDVSASVSPVDSGSSPYAFVSMELTANFIDTSNNVVLLPYSFSERDGHTSLDSAENRVFLTAERKIDKEYRDLLEAYLLKMFL